jgi:hypothetical protein
MRRDDRIDIQEARREMRCDSVSNDRITEYDGNSNDNDNDNVVIPNGSLVWYQDTTWVYLPPPFNSTPIKLNNRPLGATGRETSFPTDSFQVLGRLESENDVVDLGVISIVIRDHGNAIEIVNDEPLTIPSENLSGDNVYPTRYPSKPVRERKCKAL